MRTKTLLLSAAAIAAGLVSSQAQSNVFSANVVGYVSTVIKGNGVFTLVANPLDDGNGNQLTNLVAALPNKSQVQVWDPVSQTFTVFGKALGAWSANVSLPPGTGFFVKNGAAGQADITNVFVGSIAVANGASNSVALPNSTFILLGGTVPYSGNLTDAYNTASFNLGATLPNKSQVQVWDPVAQAFTVYGKALGAWSAPVSVSPGQGVFIKSGTATNWVESLQLQ